MNAKNKNTKSETQMERCWFSLVALDAYEHLTPEQQDLYDRIVACERPENWPEEHFCLETFQGILEQAQKMELAKNKLHTLMNKLQNIPASRALLTNYI